MSFLVESETANIEQKLGKYFLICVKGRTEFILELKDANPRPSNPIVLGFLENDAFSQASEHQLWFWDFNTGTLRNKLNSLCLATNDFDEIVAHTYNPSEDQQWEIKNGGIFKNEFDIALSVKNLTLYKGAHCHIIPNEGIEGQLWSFIFLPANDFFIQHIDSGKVLDIRGNSCSQGASLIAYNKKEENYENELWYEDQNGVIHSKLSDFVISVVEKNVVLYPYNSSDTSQEWVLNGNYIQNRSKMNHTIKVKNISFQPHAFLTLTDLNEERLSPEWEVEMEEKKPYIMDHDGKGKFFLIQLPYFNVVLTANMTSNLPQHVTLSKLNLLSNGMFPDNQQFFIDPLYSVVRSKQDPRLCLEIVDSYLQLNLFDKNQSNQELVLDSGKFYLKTLKGQVVTMATSGDSCNPCDMQCYLAEDSNLPMQKWSFSYGRGTLFYIKSKVNGKILEVKRESGYAACTVLLGHPKTETRNAYQLWYEDEQGLIRSKLNGYVLDTAFNSLHTDRFNHLNQHQGWVKTEEHIKNKNTNQVLDINCLKKWMTYSLGEAEIDFSDNQRWNFVFV